MSFLYCQNSDMASVASGWMQINWRRVSRSAVIGLTVHGERKLCHSCTVHRQACLLLAAVSHINCCRASVPGVVRAIGSSFLPVQSEPLPPSHA